MNILLVSQCQKNALKQTRRILDQFAERCGDRVWQTPITQAGLQTLKMMLRQTARKNTAVACYWTHGKNLTELLWIVGDKSQFNQRGRVPTNRTKRNILRVDDEHPWKNAYTIQLIVALAALLHDLGKANVAFQQKLKANAKFYPDLFRHEWVSVRLFEAMINGCQTDQQWLQRLADWDNYQKNNPDWLNCLTLEGKNQINQAGFLHLPPLAKLLVWLIASHHRAMFLPQFSQNAMQQKAQIPIHFEDLYRNFSASAGWVYQAQSKHPQPDKFWEFETLASDSLAWQKMMTRWANKTLRHQGLMNSLANMQQHSTSSYSHYFSDPLLLLLTRLSLISADHSYSASPASEELGEANFPLIANTDQYGQSKQRLDEHLIGVCQSAVNFARVLPNLVKHLPALNKHKPFNQLTPISRFHWQNKAFQLAKMLNQKAQKQGFFGINMASTGCGKTLANARIMYGLADPVLGARFTIALGLRTLTLQTGQALKNKLKLDDDMLAILVGNSAVRQLMEWQQQDMNAQDLSVQEKMGSESAQDWLESWQVDGGIVNDSGIESLAQWHSLLTNPKAKTLLQTPLVSCTIDHLIQASECLRGGKHIIPILRLFSSDLILDEPDDFNQQDLPALSRLIYLAGLLGSRVLLSSATLTPDLVQGLFEAYQAGRQVWQENYNLKENKVCCAWFDEFNQQTENCADKQVFAEIHQQFVQKRVANLAKQAVRRKAEILPLASVAGAENQLLNWDKLAQGLIEQAMVFHQRFASQDPILQKQVSVGLVRFANIKPMIPTIQVLFRQQLPSDTQLHICCYHSQQLLCLRSQLEEKLDRILMRSQPNCLFEQLEIHSELINSPYQQHIFMVVGSPVTEVGRDHDYDWAIVDPSSMRSIIQLAGRVWRHRPEKIAEQANIAILPSNWRGLRSDNYKQVPTRPVFYQPGFENDNYLLKNHNICDLIPPHQMENINAIARVINDNVMPPRRNKNNGKWYANSLSDLEHLVMQNLFNSPDLNYINGYWRSETKLFSVHYPLCSPFRYSRAEEDFVCLPDEQSDWQYSMAYSKKAYSCSEQELVDCQRERNLFQYSPIPTEQQVKPWLVSSLSDSLNSLAEKVGEENLNTIARTFATVSLPKNSQSTYLGWKFNEFLGFWQEN